MKDDKRFKITQKETSLSIGTNATIICDKETGVQYLIASTGFGGGITVLVDKDGKPLLHK